MADTFSQTCFQIEAQDNVCTTLTDLLAGTIKVNGNATLKEIAIGEAIQSGHKLANREIQPDEPIIKYGVVIGKAKCLIQPGQWVHLHNCRSLYDERSETLDLKTGAPTDTKYE